MQSSTTCKHGAFDLLPDSQVPEAIVYIVIVDCDGREEEQRDVV